MKNILFFFLKPRSILSLGLALAFASGFGGTAGAQINLYNPSCVISKIDGERVPFPLRRANTKFELAENETYLLNGTIVQMDGKTYFRVDFQSQPWLETERMLQFPYLPLEEAVPTPVQFQGQLVQLAVVVRKNERPSIVEGGSGRVKLTPILPPQMLRN